MKFNQLQVGDRFVFIGYFDAPGLIRTILEKINPHSFCPVDSVPQSGGTYLTFPDRSLADTTEVILIFSPVAQEAFWDAGKNLCGFCFRLGSWWVYGKARRDEACLEMLKIRLAGDDDVDFQDQTSVELTFVAKPHEELPVSFIDAYAPELVNRIWQRIEAPFFKGEGRVATFDADGRFVCPICLGSHNRGAINGKNVYRCLRCGQCFPVPPQLENAEN